MTQPNSENDAGSLKAPKESASNASALKTQYKNQVELIRYIALITLPIDLAFASAADSLPQGILIDKEFLWFALVITVVGLFRWELIAVIQHIYYLVSNLSDRGKTLLGLTAFGLFILGAIIDIAGRLEGLGTTSIILIILYLGLLAASSYRDVKNRVDEIVERRSKSMSTEETAPVLFGILLAAIAAARALPLIALAAMPNSLHVFALCFMLSVFFLLSIDPDTEFASRPCMSCGKENFVLLERSGICQTCSHETTSKLQEGRNWRPAPPEQFDKTAQSRYRSHLSELLSQIGDRYGNRDQDAPAERHDALRKDSELAER